MRGRALWLLAPFLLWLPCAAAQPLSAKQQVEKARSLFEHGDFRQALDFARGTLSSQNFEDPQRLAMNKYAGLSAFHLGELPVAEDHLLRVLQLQPDYELDPFEVPPSAVSFFAEIRKRNAEALAGVREQLKKRLEQAQREAEERGRQRVAEEERRRKLEELSRRVTVRTVEKRSFALNFVPFGAGQFQQGRTGMGVLLASSEGALAATSLVAYLALEAMLQRAPLPYQPLIKNEDSKVSVAGVLPGREGEARAWQLTQYISGGTFYAVYALGVLDALLHHRDEVVSESVVEIPGPSQPAPAPPAKTFHYPSPGGLGAGLTLTF